MFYFFTHQFTLQTFQSKYQFIHTYSHSVVAGQEEFQTKFQNQVASAITTGLPHCCHVKIQISLKGFFSSFCSSYSINLKKTTESSCISCVKYYVWENVSGSVAIMSYESCAVFCKYFSSTSKMVHNIDWWKFLTSHLGLSVCSFYFASGTLHVKEHAYFVYVFLKFVLDVRCDCFSVSKLQSAIVFIHQWFSFYVFQSDIAASHNGLTYSLKLSLIKKEKSLYSTQFNCYQTHIFCPKLRIIIFLQWNGKSVYLLTKPFAEKAFALPDKIDSLLDLCRSLSPCSICVLHRKAF